MIDAIDCCRQRLESLIVVIVHQSGYGLSSPHPFPARPLPRNSLTLFHSLPHSSSLFLPLPLSLPFSPPFSSSLTHSRPHTHTCWLFSGLQEVKLMALANAVAALSSAAPGAPGGGEVHAEKLAIRCLVVDDVPSNRKILMKVSWMTQV